jgi:Ni/Co efflux regulator RcnB
MKKLIIGAFALSLIAAPAMAAPGHGNHNNNNWTNHNNGHMDNHMSNHMGGNHMKHHGWKKGQRLSSQWRHGHEVDWRAHHLRQPPRGYHWVQTDGDYVLAAVATGVILTAIFANQ